VFSNDTKVSFLIGQEEVVSGKSVSSQVQFGSITELESVDSEDHLFIQIGDETFLQVQSSPDVNSLSLVFEGQVGGERLESVGGLELRSDDDGLNNRVSSEVTPDSDGTSVVEFSFEVSSFDVGNNLDFRRGNGLFSLVSTELEVKSSLAGNSEKVALAGVLNSQEFIVNVVITQDSGIVQVELAEFVAGSTNGSGDLGDGQGLADSEVGRSRGHWYLRQKFI